MAPARWRGKKSNAPKQSCQISAASVPAVEQGGASAGQQPRQHAIIDTGDATSGAADALLLADTPGVSPVHQTTPGIARSRGYSSPACLDGGGPLEFMVPLQHGDYEGEEHADDRPPPPSSSRASHHPAASSISSSPESIVKSSPPASPDVESTALPGAEFGDIDEGFAWSLDGSDSSRLQANPSSISRNSAPGSAVDSTSGAVDSSADRGVWSPVPGVAGGRGPQPSLQLRQTGRGVERMEPYQWPWLGFERQPRPLVRFHAFHSTAISLIALLRSCHILPAALQGSFRRGFAEHTSINEL